MKNHGNSKREQFRGQIAIDKHDIVALTDVIQEPDTVVYGLKNDIGRDIIVSIKKMGDSLVVVEEVRSGRKKVALNSMSKYPQTIHATSILKSLYPTSETLLGNGASVVQNPMPRNSQNSGILKRSGNTNRTAYNRAKADGKIDNSISL